METVISRDGTPIAYDRVGSGPALILVDGALGHRAWADGLPRLASLLAPHFTVITYDRRGRGESGDSGESEPFSVQCEIEDIEALIDMVGGSASLYGVSSGAALAMEAAVSLGGKVRHLAMYEAPYNDEAQARQAWNEYRDQLDTLIPAGRKGDAVGAFMMLVGMPAEHLPGVRQSPAWPALEAVGHTLIYDAAVLGEEAEVPVERAARVTAPTLVMYGEASYPFMRMTALALARAIPNARCRGLTGQTHEVEAEALAPVLIEFFAS